jgi:hypothetical protein
MAPAMDAVELVNALSNLLLQSRRLTRVRKPMFAYLASGLHR